MNFLNKIGDGKYEFIIDGTIFPIDVILKTSYNFLDKGYFYFKKNDSDVILQFSKKPQIKMKSEKILNDYSDELLNNYLRHKIEKENKIVRESIVKKALLGISGIANEDAIGDIILNEIRKDPQINIEDEEISNILSSIKKELGN